MHPEPIQTRIVQISMIWHNIQLDHREHFICGTLHGEHLQRRPVLGVVLVLSEEHWLGVALLAKAQDLEAPRGGVGAAGGGHGAGDVLDAETWNESLLVIDWSAERFCWDSFLTIWNFEAFKIWNFRYILRCLCSIHIFRLPVGFIGVDIWMRRYPLDPLNAQHSPGSAPGWMAVRGLLDGYQRGIPNKLEYKEIYH